MKSYIFPSQKKIIIGILPKTSNLHANQHVLIAVEKKESVLLNVTPGLVTPALYRHVNTMNAEP